MLADVLELGHGLAAAVDLDRPDVERHLADQAVEQLRGASGGGAGREAVLAQATLPAAGRSSGATDRLQGGRLRGTFEAKLVEQRELVEALGGRRRKFVADRIETIKFAVRTFGLHGAFSSFSATGLLSSAMLPENVFARPHVSDPGHNLTLMGGGCFIMLPSCHVRNVYNNSCAIVFCRLYDFSGFPRPSYGPCQPKHIIPLLQADFLI